MNMLWLVLPAIMAQNEEDDLLPQMPRAYKLKMQRYRYVKPVIENGDTMWCYLLPELPVYAISAVQIIRTITMLTGDIALRVVRMRVISERSIMFLNKSVEAYMVISITTRYDFSRYTVRKESRRMTRMISTAASPFLEPERPLSALFPVGFFFSAGFCASA